MYTTATIKNEKQKKNVEHHDQQPTAYCLDYLKNWKNFCLQNSHLYVYDECLWYKIKYLNCMQKDHEKDCFRY